GFGIWKTCADSPVGNCGIPVHQNLASRRRSAPRRRSFHFSCSSKFVLEFFYFTVRENLYESAIEQTFFDLDVARIRCGLPSRLQSTNGGRIPLLFAQRRHTAIVDAGSGRGIQPHSGHDYENELNCEHIESTTKKWMSQRDRNRSVPRAYWSI